MKVNYYLSPYPHDDGSRCIRMYITVRGDRFYFKTPLKLSKKDCPQPKGKISKRTEREVIPLKLTLPLKGNGELKDITELLKKWEAEAMQHWRNALKYDHKPNKEYFERNLSFIEHLDDNFFVIWDEYVESNKKLRAWSKLYEKQVGGVVKNKLLDLHKKKKFSFESIDHKFLDRFIDLHVKEGLLNTYTNQNITSLKVFLAWATKNDYNRNLAYQKWDDKLPEPNDDDNLYYLTIEELNKVIEHDFADQEIKDCFLFQCFTGLRYSDVKKLKKADVNGDHINITTKKTRKTIQVPLNDVSRSILKKYEDTHSDLALPVPHPNKYNTGISTLGKDAGLNRPVDYINYCGRDPKPKKYRLYQKMSSHTGRKTFITTAVYLGIPVEVVIAITGQTYEVAKRYYKIQEEHKSREMEKFNTNLKIVS